MIRGADPVPGAWGLLSDKEVQLYGSEKVDGPSGAPGEITNISSEGMVIACGEGQLRVTRVRADGEKIAAGEFAEKNDLSAGAVLT